MVALHEKSDILSLFTDIVFHSTYSNRRVTHLAMSIFESVFRE